MEHRVTVTYGDQLGEHRADELLDAPRWHGPDLGPVITEGPDGFAIVLVVDAPDVASALAGGCAVATSALADVGLSPAVRGTEVEPVGAPVRSG